MQLLLIILKPVLQSAAISLLTGTLRNQIGRLSALAVSSGLVGWKTLSALMIGVIAGVLLAWNFKPVQIDVIEKIVDREVIIEVIPPLNCKPVELLAGIKKGEPLTKLIRPYAELKAAYVACLNSIDAITP